MSSGDEAAEPAPASSGSKGPEDQTLDPSIYPEGVEFVPPPPEPHPESRPVRKVGSLLKRLSDTQVESIGSAVDAANAQFPEPDDDVESNIKADALHCLTHLPKRRDCAV